MMWVGNGCNARNVSTHSINFNLCARPLRKKTFLSLYQKKLSSPSTKYIRNLFLLKKLMIY